MKLMQNAVQRYKKLAFLQINALYLYKYLQIASLFFAIRPMQVPFSYSARNIMPNCEMEQLTVSQ